MIEIQNDRNGQEGIFSGIFIEIFSDRLFVSVRADKVRLKLLMRMSLEFRNLLLGVFKVVNHAPRNAW